MDIFGTKRKALQATIDRLELDLSHQKKHFHYYTDCLSRLANGCAKHPNYHAFYKPAENCDTCKHMYSIRTELAIKNLVTRPKR